MKPNIVKAGAVMRETYTPPPGKPMYGSEAAELFLASLKANSNILDIGGGGEDTRFAVMCREAGHTYTNFDWRNGDDWENPTTRASMLGAYDGVWMCHVLEHMLNPHAALQKVKRVLKPGGVFAVTIPPPKDQIVGGHVNSFNAGMLLYRMILAGFDCSNAALKRYGYNISVVVRNRQMALPHLLNDCGDIETLSVYFPKAVNHGFDGTAIDDLNWGAV